MLTEDWKREIVAMAKATNAMMDGSIQPIENVISSNSLVFAVWRRGNSCWNGAWDGKEYTMISDVLADAVDQIRRWLEEFPHIYSGYEEDISDLLTKMDKLRGELDAMPPGSMPTRVEQG